MSRRRKHSPILELIAWGLNIAGVFVLLVVIIIYLAGQPNSAIAAPPNPHSETALPTTTAYPLPYYLPTITPNPLTTKIVPVTSTPFVLASGRRGAVIGFSVSGRPIEVYTFGDGPKERMIVAGIHGGYEWNTIALAELLIEYLDEHEEDVIPNDVTLYIVPNMNPDGEARGHDIYGRVNDHGVDLNRNFPANWVAEWDRDGCWDLTTTTGGIGPGSEPETRAIMNFIESHNIEALISYHSAALGIFPGGIPWEENSKDLAIAIKRVSTYPYPPIDTGCEYTGTLADYAVEQGAAAVDMELTNHRDTDYDMNVKILGVFLNWEPNGKK